MAQQLQPDLSTDTDWPLYIDGEWTTPSDAGTLEVLNPHTQEQFAEVPAATTDTVDEAFASAEAAQKEWAQAPPQERAGVVAGLLQQIDKHHDEIVDLIVNETGKSYLAAETAVHIAEGHIQYASSYPFNSEGSYDESIIPGKENIVEREPVGVVAAIVPWNFPFNLTMRIVPHAVALGNSVVLKPAPDTPVVGGALIAYLFEQAGLPDGVLNVVSGHDDEIGDHISGHPTADVMSFTGSSEVGKHVGSRAVEQLTYPALELGGNNPHIVREDADLEYAVNAGSFASFVHSGQVCISINRHLVHESLYQDYVGALTEAAEEVPTGIPLEDPDAIVGPVINESQRDRIMDFIDDTIAAGATLETGGDYDGLVVEPTVLSDVTNDMPLACNEHFGPVAPVIPFSSDEEAIKMANDTRMGLSASIHSSDVDKARSMASQIESGTVHINDQTINDEPHIPFGGVKDSGLGRYNAKELMRTLTQTKWVSVMHSQREYPF